MMIKHIVTGCMMAASFSAGNIALAETAGPATPAEIQQILQAPRSQSKLQGGLQQLTTAPASPSSRSLAEHLPRHARIPSPDSQRIRGH